MTVGAEALASAVARETVRAAGARWLTIGVVTAFGSNQITATIDGAPVANIRRISSWTAPAASDVGLFAVVRGSSSVQYVGLGKITP